MKEFKYVIQDAQGIHARPAGILVKAAGGFKSDIQLDKDAVSYTHLTLPTIA